MTASILALVLAAATANLPSATPQAMFDQATTDAFAGRCTPALATFATLAARPSVQKNDGVRGAIEVRQAYCLTEQHKLSEAEPLARAALASLPKAANYRPDRMLAMQTLGRIAYLGLDYASAKPWFEQALAESGDDRERITNHFWIARATMFDGDGVALQHADAAMALAKSQPDLDKKRLADFRTMHARALLNAGRETDAFAELKQSLAAQGGLTTRVSLVDIVTRSDLAIAALLNKNSDAARQYLAYSGAGHFDKSAFARGVDMTPPACGGPADIKPDDSAIVEFSITDQGVVTGAQPIWASRSGPMAVEFARAVAGWSWTAEDAVNIPQFFRFVTRLELRCTNTYSRPDVMLRLDEATEAWLFSIEAPPLRRDGSAALALPALRAELARRTNEGDSPKLASLLFAIGFNPAAPREERAAALGRAERILTAAKAPVRARAFAAVSAMTALIEDNDDGWRRTRLSMRRLLEQPEFANDAEVAATIRMLAANWRRDSQLDDAAALLEEVAVDPRLPAKHPLRVGALVRLADIRARQGQIAAARDAYAKTGLSAQQCALVGPSPVMTRTGASSEDFPMAAMRWGFEGWVRVEADIAADGRTLNQRAIVAYPPFVFREAAVGIAKSARFTQSYRPEGALGCSGWQTNINFKLR